GTRRCQLIERIVDQRIIAAVDSAVVVEVAVGPTRCVGAEAVVDLLVVGAVDGAVKIGIAVVGVLNENVADAGRLIIKGDAAGVQHHAEAGQERVVVGSGGRDDSTRSIPVPNTGVETDLEQFGDVGQGVVVRDYAVVGKIQTAAGCDRDVIDDQHR